MSTIMGGGSSKNVAGQVVVRRNKVPKELSAWGALPTIPPQVGTASDSEKSFVDWEFDVLQLQPMELIALSMHMIEHLDLHTKFSLDAQKWCNMMFDVQTLMGTADNPYHNFYHVIDVTQSCFVMLSKFEAAALFSDIDVFAILISAIVHDLEHPGTNNMYQINASTPLAIRYNDISVLENHHCAKAFELLAQPECSVFIPFSADNRKYLRRAIIAMVLATDMSMHFGLKDELDKLVVSLNDGRVGSSTKDSATALLTPAEDASSTKKLTEKETFTVMKSILHTADISNPARPWGVSRKWSDLVLQEFFAQGDREKRENLPVSMNCDRSTTSQDELSINFTDFIVAPFFFSLTKLIPKLLPACKYLEQNRDQWNEQVVQRLQSTGNDESKEVLDKLLKRKEVFSEKVLDLEQVVVSTFSPRI